MMLRIDDFSLSTVVLQWLALLVPFTVRPAMVSREAGLVEAPVISAELLCQLIFNAFFGTFFMPVLFIAFGFRLDIWLPPVLSLDESYGYMVRLCLASVSLLVTLFILW